MRAARSPESNCRGSRPNGLQRSRELPRLYFPGLTHTVFGLRIMARDDCHFFGIIEEMPKPNYLGEFELLVMLTVLRLGDDAYGVPISREIERQTGRDVAFGTVYSTLERLQEKGFVCSNLGDATRERGGRAKRYFRVTSAGLRTVRETKQSLIGLWQGLRELQGGVA